MDLVMRPELVHAGVERTVQAWMVEMDQFESMNLLSLDNDETQARRAGPGTAPPLRTSPLRSRTPEATRVGTAGSLRPCRHRRYWPWRSSPSAAGPRSAVEVD